MAKGQYKGKIILNKRLQIIGACSKEVKISNDLKTKDKLIIEAQKAVSLFNLSISGYSGAIKINNNKSKSVLKGIILKDIIGDSALIVENSHLEINGLFIENISGFKNVKESGGGVLIKDSEVFMEKVFINKSRNHAISISGEKSQVKIKSIIIKKTLKDEQTKNYGFGIQLSKGNLSLERALFKENQGTDIFLTAAKSIQLKDININGSDSQGINCRESENVFLERISILNNQYGMYFHKVKMPNPSKDILIKNSMGFALSLANQNEANFERISILENQDTGVFSNGPSSKNYIKDALIMENGGAGVMLNNGKLNLIRSLINRNKRNGVSVIAESNAQFEDVYVNQNLDAGLELKGRSSLVGKRISFINNYQVSLAVSEYSNLSFDEALIKKTQGSHSYSG